ncbi:MAG TPA: DUF1559 domain-containing protein [Pirellulales bacterium]|jgi:type II secretory pathway pseudopilin PulG
MTATNRHWLSRRHAVTLVETLVAFAIIAMLLGLLLPALHYARESSRSATCANNLRQIEFAWDQASMVRKKWPPHPEGTISGWAIVILPFLEQTQLADALSGNPMFDPNTAPQAARKRPGIMTCPSGFDESSDAKEIPVAHYAPSNTRMADVPTDFRVPWVLSPTVNRGLAKGKGPHWGGGYNVTYQIDESRFGVRFVTGN